MMNVKLGMVCAVCCLITWGVKGQYNKDSIRKVVAQIRAMPLDTLQAVKLRMLGHDLIESDSALSKQLLDEAVAKAIKIKEPNTITNSYRLLGIWHSYFEEYDKALECYRLSYRSALENNNQYLMAGASFNMGNVKYWKGEYDSCIHFYIQAAEVFENPKILEDKTVAERQLDLRKSDLYSNLSIIFNSLKNLPKADEYIDKAIAIAKKYDSPTAANALAQYMQHKADNHFENGQTEKALRIRLAFLPQLEKRTIAKVYLQGTYQNIAQEYFLLDKIDSSRHFAEKSLALATTLKVKGGIANANWQLARIFLEEEKPAQAEKHLALAQAYYEDSEDPVEQRNYFSVMRELKFEQGKFKEAYLYFEKFTSINDSLFKSERAREFSEREMRYETEKKETQIKLQQAALQEKNILNYVLIGGAIVLASILLLMYRNYRHRQKIQQQRISELEKEKQLTATEAVLRGEEQERTRLAKDLHDGLGGMLSGIKYTLNTMKGNLIMTPENQRAFERSIDMLDSSIREMRRVAHNMMPEALVKFGLDTALKDFCQDVNQSGALQVNYQSIGLGDAQIEQTTAITIYRVIQELLNNVIRHAAAKQAIVQVGKVDNTLSVTVEDDGKGFDLNILKESRGIGWSSIQNRVEFLKGHLDVHSSPGKGTSVHIEFNV